MIDVGMAEDDGVDVAGSEGEVAVALPRLGALALKEAAIEQDLAPPRFHQVHRPGDGVGGAPEGDGDGVHGVCQSSNVKPGTRLNSTVLCVTKVRWFTFAIAAIIKSQGPIGVPIVLRRARVRFRIRLRQRRRTEG